MAGTWNRRSALRAGVMMAGLAATAPLLLGESAASPRRDADALFKAGKFEEAAHAYEEIFEKDPTNLHAARRRGYVALLSNDFPDAEKWLTRALELAPNDQETNKLLGDCYLRQDKFAHSVPCWKAAGNDIYAAWFAAVRGEPYQIHGDVGRLPWLRMDPYPVVEVSVNGGPPKRFTFYTGAGDLSMTKKLADELKLRYVAKHKIDFLDGFMWRYYGVLDSCTLGDIELRNIPVVWTETDTNQPEDPHDGMIGTWVFAHFLTTFDYAGRSLILRRRTPEAVAKVRADAKRAGAEPLPLWQVREHMLHSKGSIANSGPRVMGVNFGGTGEIAAGLSVDSAKQLRIPTDYDRPIETFGHSHPAVTYPCYPKEVRIGDATAENAYCYAIENRPLAPYGFDLLGHFSHSFWKPYHATLDFTDMKLYVARGKAS